MQRDGKPVEKVWRKMLKKRKFTIQNVNTNAGNISIWRRAWVSSGICQISILNEQIGCCDVSLLGNYAHTAALAVVTNHLLARSRDSIEGKAENHIRCRTVLRWEHNYVSQIRQSFEISIKI